VFDDVEKGAHPPSFALATSVEIKATTQVRRFSSPEVIGLIPGTDASLRSEYIVLMGHLDHLGIREDGRKDPIFNGALDNATGIATLLEVGRALKAQPPRRSVLLIANTGEEKGLIGAQYFAAHPTVPIDRIVAGIDLDMPVLTYDFKDVVAYGGPHSTLDRIIARAAASMNIKVSSDWQPDQAIFVRSDHYALVRAGIPAVMVQTGEANGGKAAWETYMGKNYHQPSDDLTQPIRWEQGAKFAQLNYRIVRQLADQRDRPRWYEGDYFGDLYAPNAVKVKR
jgi:Zn-dependent M28 family amino/carboxypeptidase